MLTFDDGPWPENTSAVLKALADNCLKATFFEIGEHAVWHPEIAKQVAAAGHTIGSHTWSHKDLAKKPRRQWAGTRLCLLRRRGQVAHARPRRGGIAANIARIPPLEDRFSAALCASYLRRFA